jgi:hypothetical protein
MNWLGREVCNVPGRDGRSVVGGTGINVQTTEGEDIQHSFVYVMSSVVET